MTRSKNFTSEEINHIDALNSYLILNTDTEKEYDDITQLAASVCNAPVSLLCFWGENEKFLKSQHGLTNLQTPFDQLDLDFAYNSTQDVLIIEDAKNDKRYVDTSVAASNSALGFYAGAPLITPQNICIGILCVIDSKSRTLTEKQIASLNALANQVIQLLELRKARKEIEKKCGIEKKFRALVENGADAIIIVRADTTITYASPSITKVLGYTEEEALKLNLLQVLHPDDVDAIQEKFAEVMNRPGGSIQNHTSRCKHKDGSWRWLEATATNMLHDPDIQGIVDNFRDVTEKIEIQNDLQITKDKYSKLFDTSPLPAWIHDLETLQILDVNKAAIAHYGYTRTEFIGMSIVLISPFKEQSKMKETYHSSLNQVGLMWFGTFMHVKKNGDTITVEVNANKINLGNKECIIAICNDVTEKEQVLTRLKANESKLIKAQQLANLGYWQLQLDGNTLYWSDEVYKIWGVSKDNFITNYPNFLATIHPDDIKEFKKFQKKAISGEGILECEHRILLPNQSVKWVREIGKLEINEQTDSIVFEGTVQDITASKLAEERQRSTEARLAGIIASETNYVIRTDLGGLFTYYNQKFINDFGWIYGEANLIGLHWMDFIVPSHHERVEAAMEKCFIQLNAVVQVEVDNPAQNGGILTTIWDYVCLSNNRDKPTEIQCVGIDITRRKLAENAVAETNQRIENILSSIQDGFYALDRNFKVTYWNTEAERLIEIKREDIVGKNLWEEIGYMFPPQIKILYQKTMDSGEPLTFEDYVPIINRWYETTVYPLKDGLSIYFKDVSARKFSELELLQFKKIIESTKDGIAISNTNSGIVYLNSGFTALLGYDEKSLEVVGGLSKTYADRFLANRVFETLISGEHWRGDVELITKDGKHLSFFLSGGPIYNDKDQLIAYYGIYTDITTRKEAEQHLQIAFDEKNRILESIGDGFFTMDKNWYITYWNKQAEQILHKKREDAVGYMLWDIYDENSNAIFKQKYHKAMVTGESLAFEEYSQQLNLWLEVSVYPTDSGLSIYFKDTSNRKESEELIRSTNERFEMAAQATNYVIWDWDMLKDTHFINSGFVTMFGINPDKPFIKSHSWMKHVHLDDVNKVTESLTQCIEDPEKNKWMEEYRYLKKDGRYAYVLDRGVILRDSKGKAVRMVGARSDITQRKLHEESLKQLNDVLRQKTMELISTNEELEKFAYVASHDLQEPLRMVTSFLTKIEDRYEPLLDERGKKYIHLAVDGATRMRRIILDLLEYSRTNRFALTTDEIDINEVIDEVTDLYRVVIAEKKALIIYKQMPKIQSARSPIQQLFSNLIGNSLKYAKADVAPIIKITSHETQSHWEFSIKDNGIGISPHFHDKLFILFQRLHNKSEYSGTGIGLAICKKIVQRLGGEIRLESEEGQGTTILFTISKPNTTV